jgi:hypothetical protein
MLNNFLEKVLIINNQIVIDNHFFSFAAIKDDFFFLIFMRPSCFDMKNNSKVTEFRGNKHKKKTYNRVA